jgi:hypothetical protein
MDPIERWLRDVLRLAGEIYFAWANEELWRFTQALYEWLHELFAHPTPKWREEFAGFLTEQEAAGRVMLGESQRVVLDYLETWAATVDWASLARKPVIAPNRSSGGFHEVDLGGLSNPDYWQDKPAAAGFPDVSEPQGRGTLDELLDPELPPLVSSAEEYRKSQIEARGDSWWSMGLTALNQAINRYVWGIEDRHVELESPGERVANDIADLASDVSDQSLGVIGARTGQGRSIVKAPPGKVRAGKPIDKSWKGKIAGRAQKTGTAGNAFRSYREAIRMAKSGEYDRIWLNRAYSTTTGTRTTPRRLPDVIGRRVTGQFDAFEVPSKTNDWDELLRRNQEALDQLPDTHRGQVRLTPIIGEAQK